MTSRTSEALASEDAAECRRRIAGGGSRRGGARGFTLLELLVVVGVMVLLFTMAGYYINRARRSANESRVKLDMQAIATALEQFKADHKDYPGLVPVPVGITQPIGGNRTRLNHSLAYALIGPGAMDGIPGPGFLASAGGKKWNPYLSPDKFEVRTSPGPDNQIGTADDTYDILDYFGNPIQYYPRRNRSLDPARGPLVAAGPAMYDERDGGIPRRTLQIVLGDENADNRIGGGERLRHDGFILASPGRDGVFSDPGNPPDVKKVLSSDDIYNIDR